MIRRTALGFAALTLGLPLATPVRALGPVASIEQERAEGSEPLFVFTTRLTEFSPLGEIRFESKARVLSCCLKYVPDVELRGRVLRIFERDEGPACDCEDVPWDLQAILVDVDPGDYEVYLHDAKGTLLATALVTVPTTMTQAFVRGRVNDDDKTNVADAVALVEHLFRGKRGPACPDAADVNDDGKVNLADAIHLLAYLFTGEATMPEPYPEAGEDRTPDAILCSTEESVVARDFYRSRDVNHSGGEPTITDALYWLMAQTTGGWPSCEDSLDLNDDGVLDDFDACLILTIVCELQPPPEPIVTMEPLTCGPDPTPDRLGCRDLGCYDP